MACFKRRAEKRMGILWDVFSMRHHIQMPKSDQGESVEKGPAKNEPRETLCLRRQVLRRGWNFQDKKEQVKVEKK